MFCRTTTEIQSDPAALEEAKAVTISNNNGSYRDVMQFQFSSRQEKRLCIIHQDQSSQNKCHETTLLYRMQKIACLRITN